MESNIASAVCTDERASMIREWIDGASLPVVYRNIVNSFKVSNFIVTGKNDECAAKKGTETLDS